MVHFAYKHYILDLVHHNKWNNLGFSEVLFSQLIVKMSSNNLREFTLHVKKTSKMKTRSYMNKNIDLSVVPPAHSQLVLSSVERTKVSPLGFPSLMMIHRSLFSCRLLQINWPKCPSHTSQINDIPYMKYHVKMPLRYFLPTWFLLCAKYLNSSIWGASDIGPVLSYTQGSQLLKQWCQLLYCHHV